MAIDAINTSKLSTWGALQILLDRLGRENPGEAAFYKSVGQGSDKKGERPMMPAEKTPAAMAMYYMELSIYNAGGNGGSGLLQDAYSRNEGMASSFKGAGAKFTTMPFDATRLPTGDF